MTRARSRAYCAEIRILQRYGGWGMLRDGILKRLRYALER